MVQHLRLTLFICGILTASSSGWAQRSARYQKNVPALGVIKLIGGVGGSYYLGDLQDGINMKHMHPHVALGLSYRLTERIVLRGEARFFRLSGSHEGTKVWYNNLSFRSDNPDGYIGGQIELFKFSSQPRLNPYFIGGIGLTHLNPKAKLDGVWYSLPPLTTEGVTYQRSVRFWTVGIGTSFPLNDQWSVGVELTQNFVNSDYLDDVSNVYPDFSSLSDVGRALSDRRPELGLEPNLPGNIRGNPRNNDAYGFLSFRAEYMIGSRFKRAERRKLKCSY